MTGTVIITGVSSFAGTHLAAKFHLAGWKVIGTYSKNIDGYSGIQANRLDALKPEIELRQLDIRNNDAAADLLSDIAPSMWVHHGGYADNYGSMDYDWSVASSINVAPLYHLYPLFVKSQTRVVITGSSAEYMDGDLAAHEDDTCLPAMPYGLSKLSETLCARQLAEHYEVPTRVARLFIPFGTFDNPKKLMASVIENLSEGKPIDLSPCDQKRDFIGIRDVCDGYLRIADDMDGPMFDLYNLCSGQATMLRTLLLEVAGIIGVDNDLLNFGARPMRPGEPEISYGDSSKAKQCLGWSVRSLPDALRDDLLEPKELFV